MSSNLTMNLVELERDQVFSEVKERLNLESSLLDFLHFTFKLVISDID